MSKEPPTKEEKDVVLKSVDLASSILKHLIDSKEAREDPAMAVLALAQALGKATAAASIPIEIVYPVLEEANKMALRILLARKISN